MGNVFIDITVVICLAALLTLVFRFFKQPLILAYILTGVLIGPFAMFQLGSRDLLRTMGELGITLLLFILGLELRLDDFRSIGKVAILAGIVQIIFTWVSGYFISSFLGFSNLTSIYLGLVLTFSSTIIAVKLLSDKKDLKSLYGKISIGILLVQDFFAIFILVFLSGFKGNEIASFSSLTPFGFILLKGLLLFGAIFFLSKTIFPKIIDSIARSGESLFLVSIALAFGMAALVSSPIIGFSIEIGGLLAGLALANSNSSYQIAARVRSLRDFFITIFFIFLGTQMVFDNFSKIIIPAIILSLLVLIVKPLFTIIVLGLMGYRKRTSFLTGITIAQISEFSLITIFLANKIGHVENEIISLVAVISIITFIASNYMVVHSVNFYRTISKYIGFFELKNAHKEKIEEVGDLKNHIVLIGAHRMGESILNSLEKKKDPVAVVDFDPDIVKKLKDKEEIVSIFGDISDLDIQERAKLKEAKMVISTVPDMEDNLNLIKGLNHSNRLARIIVLAQDIDDAKTLYKAGADYVVLPHLVGGMQVAKLLKEDSLSSLHELKSKDLNYLN